MESIAEDDKPKELVSFPLKAPFKSKNYSTYNPVDTDLKLRLMFLQDKLK
jgi:hypothetical protein